MVLLTGWDLMALYTCLLDEQLIDKFGGIIFASFGIVIFRITLGWACYATVSKNYFIT